MQLLSSSSFVHPSVWETICTAMRTESGTTFMASRTTPEALQTVFEAGHALLGMVDDEPIAFIAAWDAPAQCLEVGAAWVRADHRGRGLGTRLIRALLELICGKASFAITTKPAFIQAAQHAGMINHTDWHQPIPWEATCGPCDWIADDKKVDCELRRCGTCRLLLPSTSIS